MNEQVNARKSQVHKGGAAGQGGAAGEAAWRAYCGWFPSINPYFLCHLQRDGR